MIKEKRVVKRSQSLILLLGVFSERKVKILSDKRRHKGIFLSDYNQRKKILREIDKTNENEKL